MAVDEKKERKSDAAYSWSQGQGDVTVTFMLPDGTTKDKVTCVIKVDHIKVAISNNTLLEGPLFTKIDPDGSTWIIEGTRYLSICLSIG